MEQYRHPYWKHHRWPQGGVYKIEFLRGFFPSHSNPNVRIYSHAIQNFENAGKIFYLYLLALQSRIPSMIEAWFKLSDITASSYKHRIYRKNQRKISYLIENNFKNTSIGIETSCIQNSIFGIVHFCNLLLQFQVNFLCSTNKSSRTYKGFKKFSVNQITRSMKISINIIRNFQKPTWDQHHTFQHSQQFLWQHLDVQKDRDNCLHRN